MLPYAQLLDELEDCELTTGSHILDKGVVSHNQKMTFISDFLPTQAVSIYTNKNGSWQLQRCPPAPPSHVLFTNIVAISR